MLSKPAWSWLDAVIIGVLLVAGTSAMVEARNRVVIDPPEEADLAEAVKPAPTQLCSVISPTGDIFFMPYIGQPAASLADAPTVSCPN